MNKISKNKIIFTLLLILSEKVKSEITFLLVFLQLIIFIFRYGILKEVFNISKYLIFIIIISFFIGNINMLFDSYYIKDILRDIYIFVTPIIYIFYGGYCYYLKYISKIELYQSILNAGVILSIIHILSIIINISSFTLDINNRAIAGTGSIITVLAIIILIFTPKDEQKFLSKSKLNKKIKSTILIISFILYFSRTDIALLLCFIISILLIDKKINILKILKISFITLISSIIIFSILPRNITDSFANKILNSFQEISSKNTDVWDWYSINNNWRGYEVYRAKETIADGNIVDIIAGYGMGKGIELNTKILLGEEYYTKIHILHNGYYYTILKSGIVGVILYSLFLLVLLKTGIKNIFNRRQVFESKLLCGISLGIAFSTIVVSGLYNKGSIFSYCFIIGYLSLLNKEQLNLIKAYS